MAVQSQEPPSDTSGRVNQKRRTRAAIVTAARAMLDRGESPTVAQAAEEALVSRTTAYRYFPTQESLLLELSLTLSVAEIDDLLARPLDGSTPEDRFLEVLDTFNGYVAANEALFRTAQRLYLDMWLAAERAGRTPRPRTSARAAPPMDRVDPRTASRHDPRPGRERLEAALCLVMGGDAFTVLRDVCQLSPDEAVAVADWAAEAILTAGLRP